MNNKLTKETHMSTTNLPNLSTWHRVPVGMTIPKGIPYAYTDEVGINVILKGYFEGFTVRDGVPPHYTEEPITHPLPTEEGATILASGNDLPPHTLLTHKGGRWVNRYGVEWSAEQIRAWCPVTLGETVVMR